MNAKPFLDTNVLIYAFSRDDSRTSVSVSLLESGGIVSIQNINEFTDVSRKKLCRTWEEIEAQIRTMRRLLDPPLSLRTGHHELAVSISKQFGFRIFDSLIIASALSANCPILYTEDLQHGQRIEDLTIRNPFIS